MTLWRCHAKMVRNGDFSYGDFAEYVDFAYWWSFINKGLRAAIKAGLLIYQVLIFPQSLRDAKTHLCLNLSI